jgi:hypothetical protein
MAQDAPKTSWAMPSRQPSTNGSKRTVVFEAYSKLLVPKSLPDKIRELNALPPGAAISDWELGALLLAIKQSDGGANPEKLRDVQAKMIDRLHAEHCA